MAEKQEQTAEQSREVVRNTTPLTVGLSPQGGLVPKDMESLWRLSTIMAASGFMPKGIERTESVFVAVQMGLEVGLTPMQAVQNIAVINGRPALWGDAQLGLVESSGLLEEFEEFFEGEFPKDDFKAVCTAKRKGRRKPVRNEFSIADAKTSGLLNKEGPWRQYPKRMLKMRARAFTLRDGFSDVLKGLKSVEEARDIPFEGIEMELGPGGMYEAGSEESGAIPEEDPQKMLDEHFWSAVEANGLKRDDPDFIAHLNETAAFFKMDVAKIKAQLVENEAELKTLIDGFRKKQAPKAAEPGQQQKAQSTPAGPGNGRRQPQRQTKLDNAGRHYCGRDDCERDLNSQECAECGPKCGPYNSHMKE